jgi:uncharacterized membrane protein YeiB
MELNTAAADTAPAPAPDQGSGRASVGRLVGVDLARGLAVFGMCAVHVGPGREAGGVTGPLMAFAEGRSSALFAFLAGFSLILITGRPVPKTGRAGRQAVVKVVIRAVILLVLGTVLTLIGAPVLVILAFYGVFFLLVLPLHRLGFRWLALIAAGGALVLPQLRHLLLMALPDDPQGGWAVLSWPDGADGLRSLFVDGTYPAMTWVPFVIAGMAVARLDLTSTAIRVRLAVTGAALALIGYGGSWLALRLVPGAAELVGLGTDMSGSTSSDMSAELIGSGLNSPAWLLVAEPHSETTWVTLGNIGVALMVLTACLVVAGLLPRVTRPVVAVGSMSLTAYLLHIAFIAGLNEFGIEYQTDALALLTLIAALMVVATVWSLLFRRGPVEWLMGRATKPAEFVR